MPLQTPMQNSLQTLTDEQLMQAYAAGEVAAFDVLYARNEGALFRFVRRRASRCRMQCWMSRGGGRRACQTLRCPLRLLNRLPSRLRPWSRQPQPRPKCQCQRHPHQQPLRMPT